LDLCGDILPISRRLNAVRGVVLSRAPRHEVIDCALRDLRFMSQLKEDYSRCFGLLARKRSLGFMTMCRARDTLIRIAPLFFVQDCT
jgi:hypothetical protein